MDFFYASVKIMFVPQPLSSNISSGKPTAMKDSKDESGIKKCLISRDKLDISFTFTLNIGCRIYEKSGINLLHFLLFDIG